MYNCKKLLGIVALAFGLPAATQTTAVWYKIADEANPTFTTKVSTVVHYGASQSWVQKTVLGNGMCSNAFFGIDPIRGTAKSCKVFGVPPTTTVGLGQLPANPVVNTGYTAFRVDTTYGQNPPNSHDGTGNFRTRCTLSHYSFNDPIVYPSQPGRSHLHAFLGNTSTDAYTTGSNIRSKGGSTCRGGTANLSGYWIPALIDTATNLPVNFKESDIYYKSAYRGIEPKNVKPIPTGLVMLAGDPNNKTPDPYTAPYVWFCHNMPYPSNRGPSIPTSCPAGDDVTLSVFFPQCWDGKNLDSPDHRSHMSYGTGSGCPASHPVALPEVSFHIHWAVPVDGVLSRWRLSSDTYSGPAGYSAHADFMMGWDRAIADRWASLCVTAAKDCGSALLGGGWIIY